MSAVPFEKPVTCPTLIGRSLHVQALIRLFDEARKGHGQVALIAGEAGIGKSRLVAEVTAHLRGTESTSNTRVLQGNCFELDQTLPYAPISDLLRNFTASFPLEQRIAHLGAQAAPLTTLLPELASFVSVSPSRLLDPAQEKRQLYEALREFFRSQSGGHPLLVVIEDIHWSDDASLEFILYWVQHLRSFPSLLLMTYRSDEIGSDLARLLTHLDRERITTEFKLPRLTSDALAAMLRAIFNVPARTDFVDALYSLTEGNPFFVEEVLKALVARGDIFYAGGQWDRKPLDDLQIPRTIQLALQQRTEQLSAEAKHVLTLAAVTGRRFDYELLQHLTQKGDSELLSIFKELVAAQLVVEESADHFAFRHALTRQAIYTSLLTREQRLLHRQIGEAMEQGFSTDTPSEAHLAELAYHFYKAGVWTKALDYSQRAAERAQQLYSPYIAYDHYTHALEAETHLGIRPTANLLHARGQASEMLGDFDAADQDYQQAIIAATAAQDQIAEWQSLLALGFLWTGRDFQQAGRYLEQAVALARAIGDPLRLAQSLNRVGNWFANQEQPLEALRYHREALSLFQTLGDKPGLASTLDLLGLASLMGGEIVASVGYYEQAVTLLRELGDRVGLSSSLALLAMRGISYVSETAYCPPTSLEDTLDQGKEAIQIAHEIGWQAGEAGASMYLGLALGAHGQFETALQLGIQALEIATTIEHRLWITASGMLLGRLYFDLLALPQAQRSLEQAEALAREINTPFLIYACRCFLASVYLAQHEIEQAKALLDSLPEAQNTTVDTQSQMRRLFWSTRAELALARGDASAAVAILTQLVTAGDTETEQVVIPRLWYLQAKALAALNRPKEAQRLLEQAEAQAQTQGALSLLWHIQIDLGATYLLIEQDENAESTLETASRLIDELAQPIRDEVLREQFRREAKALFPRTAQPSPREAAKRSFDGLTEREREIAALVAQGKSNREIAALLVLSERTIHAHIGNILSKLNFSSRVQIARWAVEKGLA